MEENHKLALYISYYLSRFNEEALRKLGYAAWNDAYSDIANKLNVNMHSVKNWRDEFDPIHGHRAGWYQRPMSPSRVRVVRALEGLEEGEIRSLVIDILSGRIREDLENLEELLKVVPDDEKKRNTVFILRAPTGRKAEEFFAEYHKKHSKPINGELFDTRDNGCGYDFEIRNAETWYIEVKGLGEETGGILFTNLEWETAKKFGKKFFLALVSDINNNPEIQFIQDPASRLTVKKNIVTTIQIQWSVSANELRI
jgi:hypothetical protein